jgi:hypothetical protein
MPGLQHAALLAATTIAEWMIYLVPCGLTWLWLTGGTGNRRASIRACVAALLDLLTSQVIAMLWFHPSPLMVDVGDDYLAQVPDSSFLATCPHPGGSRLALWMSACRLRATGLQCRGRWHRSPVARGYSSQCIISWAFWTFWAQWAQWGRRDRRSSRSLRRCMIVMRVDYDEHGTS